jgi:hypothetical protein
MPPRRNKDCSICVYNGPCRDRKDRVDIRDCCVPEAPLRELQASSTTAEQYIANTRNYINGVKNASKYWTKTQSV